MDNLPVAPPLAPLLDAAVAIPSNAGIHQTGTANTAVQGNGNTVIGSGGTLQIVHSDGVAVLERLVQVLGGDLHAVRALLLGTANPPAPSNGIDAALHSEIDRHRSLLDSGNPEAALHQLETLRVAQAHASDLVRFRILINIGAAQLALNRLPEAATTFVKAYPLNPDDEKALGNLLRAYMIREDWPAARGVARRAVALFPAQSIAWGWAVATADYSAAVVPTEVAPAALHHTTEVAFAIARAYARNNQTTEALAWMVKVYEQNPADPDTLESLGELHLKRATVPSSSGDGLVFLQPLSAPQHEAVVKAKPFFERAWALTASAPVARFKHSLATNLALTYILLEAPAAAQELLRQLDASELPELGRLHAQLAVDRGDWPAALKALDTLPVGVYSDHSVMKAEVLAALNRPDEALALLEATLAAPTSHRTSERAQLLRLALIEERDGVEAARNEGRTTVEAGERTTRLLTHLAELEHVNGSAEEADRRFAEAQAALTPDALVPDGIAVAMALLHTERTEAGIALLETLPLPDADTPVVRRLLGSLLDADHRAAVQARLDRLPPTVRNQPYYQRAEAVLCSRRGDLDRAVYLLDAYLTTRPDDLAARLVWIQVQEQRGQSAEVTLALADGELERTTRGSLSNQMILARILAHHGYTERAWALAYETRRKATGHGTDDCAAHNGYIFLGLFGPGEKALARDFQRDIVDLDTAFTVTSQQGERTFVIETATAPNGEVGELPPTHALAQAARGLRVGDSVSIPGSPIRPAVGRITEIKHKYLHALHLSLAHHQERFPDQTGPWRLQLGRGGTPEEILAPLASLLNERRTWCEEVEEQYRTGFVPLAMMGGLLGVHAIDVWWGLAHPERPSVLTSEGTPRERFFARRVLRKRKGVVVDPITLTHIIALDAADAVTAVTGPLGVTQSTINSLRSLAAERRTFSKKGRLSVTLGPRGIERHHASAEAVADNIAFLERVIAFAETRCEPVLAQAPEDPPAQLLDLFRVVPDPAFLDTLLAARGAGRILLTDDLALRRVAAAFLDIRGVCSQAVLLKARAQRQLSAADHASMLLKMGQRRHSFISVSATDLLAIAQRDGWHATADFIELVHMLAGDTVELHSASQVFQEFVEQLWGQLVSEDAKRRVLWGALNVLLTPYRKLWGHVLSHVLNHGDKRVRGAAILWWQGHFLDVPDLGLPQGVPTRKQRRQTRA